MSTCSLSAIQIPPKRTRMRRRNGSTYSNLLGSGSGARNRPIAPVESGPCCQDSPMLPPIGSMIEAGRRPSGIPYHGTRTRRMLDEQAPRSSRSPPVAPDIAALHAAVGLTSHPAGDGPADLVRRIFLDEMEPRDRHLGLRREAARQVENRAVGENPTWLGLQEQLGNIALRQPVRVGFHDRSHVGGLALNGNLPGPRQRRPPSLAGLGERPSVLRHFLGGKSAQDGPWQDLLD